MTGAWDGGLSVESNGECWVPSTAYGFDYPYEGA